MGRPKGSKNGSAKGKTTKKLKTAKAVVKKNKINIWKAMKRGLVIESTEPSDIRSYKFIGYCKCDFMIGKFELKGKDAYECPSCGYKGKVSKISKERHNQIERPDSKKGYYSGVKKEEEVTVSSTFFDEFKETDKE